MRTAILATIVVLAAQSGSLTGEDAPPAQAPGGTPAVVRDEVPGAMRHSPGRVWDRIAGHVEVINAYTLRFADGTTIELNTEAPDLEQLARDGESLYPCGREAARFLREFIGDRPVQCYLMDPSTGIAYVGDQNVVHALIVNGWALAGHSSQHAAEVTARENRRGLWRGDFLPPDEWRQGKRLPGEEAAQLELAAESERSQRAAIVGTWESTDRHASMGSLYEPVHGVRKRPAVLHFTLEGDRLAGHCIVAHHADITGQERWIDGRTDFRLVQFADDRLMFEFDFDEWVAHAAPLAVEQGRLENRGWVRVEAALDGDRLTGAWQMFTVDGNEVFRGEWEATRAADAATE